MLDFLGSEVKAEAQQLYNAGQVSLARQKTTAAIRSCGMLLAADADLGKASEEEDLRNLPLDALKSRARGPFEGVGRLFWPF